MKNVFYGSKSNNICAFCWKHRLGLTPKQLKKRRCLKRNCDALERRPHPMWDKREEQRAGRGAKKKRLEEKYREITGRSD